MGIAQLRVLRLTATDKADEGALGDGCAAHFHLLLLGIGDPADCFIHAHDSRPG